MERRVIVLGQEAQAVQFIQIRLRGTRVRFPKTGRELAVVGSCRKESDKQQGRETSHPKPGFDTGAVDSHADFPMVQEPSASEQGLAATAIA